MNYVQLAEKFAKEKTVKEEAVLNNKILNAKMQSKIKATEAAITEREVELEIAESELEKAQATLTRDVDMWVRKVRDAQYTCDSAAESLNVAQTSLEEYTEYAKLFVVK